MAGCYKMLSFRNFVLNANEAGQTFLYIFYYKERQEETELLVILPFILLKYDRFLRHLFIVFYMSPGVLDLRSCDSTFLIILSVYKDIWSHFKVVAFTTIASFSILPRVCVICECLKGL